MQKDNDWSLSPAHLVQLEEGVDSFTPAGLRGLQQALELVYGPQLGDEVAALRGEEDQPPGRIGVLRHDRGREGGEGGDCLQFPCLDGLCYRPRATVQGYSDLHVTVM